MKILIIGQAPPAVKQEVPYDTTLLYDMLAWAGIEKSKAQELFVFDAITDAFPGHGENGHLKPTKEMFVDYLQRGLMQKIEDAEKVIILGRVAFDFLTEHPQTNIELATKRVLSLVHPSKRNYARIMKDKNRITELLNNFLS